MSVLARICLFHVAFLQSVALHWRRDTANIDAPNRKGKGGGLKGHCPSMFAAIITRPDNHGRRHEIREMWRSAPNHWGKLKARFAICADPPVDDEVMEEANLQKDIMLMNCTEGYAQGFLTRKVAAAMVEYLDNYDRYDLFMKIDDDTFISPRRICDLLRWRDDNGKENTQAYMGVFAEGPRECPKCGKLVNRNAISPWYEPESIYAPEKYPLSAKGGPGYILSRPIVENIITGTISENGQSIAENNMLYNEDKAVGVWVDKLVQAGLTTVDYVNIPGTDGYAEHNDSTVTTGALKQYPHYLHHNLTGETIACLHRLDSDGDPSARIDECFEPERSTLASTG